MFNSLSSTNHTGRWLSLFTFYNVFIALLISLRFYNQQAIPQSEIGWVFAVLHSVGQFSFLCFLLALPFFVLYRFVPQKLLKYSYVLISCSALTLLLIDTFIYQQYRFHINAMVLELFIAGGDEVISFSLTMWLIVLGVFIAALLIQLGVANWLYRFSSSDTAKRINIRIAVSAFACLLFANFIHIWGDATFNRDITKQTKILPLAYPATAKSLMAKYGVLDIEAHKQQSLLKQKKNKGNLNYPIAEIETSKLTNPMNIVMIVVDSWRADMADQDTMPNTYEFAQNSLNYTNHYSGSNNTRHGMFSVMYGIPGSYWDVILKQQQGPVLIDTLNKQGYSSQVFASAKLTMPEFDQTLFSKVANLRTHSEGELPWQRDADAVEDYLAWKAQHDSSQPSFSLLFLDAAHGFSMPQDFPKVFQPSLEDVNFLSLNDDYDAEPFINLYKNSLNYIDELIGKVLAETNDDNTIVIITSDHGKEFNDSKQGYWGHNSNYSRYQTQVPLFIKWPGKEAEEITFQTSHMSLVPTLMKEALQVSNPTSDYSSADSLFAQEGDLPWVFLGRTGYYAIKDKSHIYELDRLGNFTIFDNDYQVDEDATLNISFVQKALQEMSRFYKKN